MDNQFNPNNKIIQLLLRGMGMEDSGKTEEASLLFLKAWSEATDDFERFIAAYYVARHQKNSSDKLKWFETSLQFALKLNDVAVKSAFPSLYLNIAKCYEALSDSDKAKENYEYQIRISLRLLTQALFFMGQEQTCRSASC